MTKRMNVPIQSVRSLHPLALGCWMSTHSHSISSGGSSATIFILPKEELLTTAREIAAKIAAKSPAMVRLAKEALTGIEDGNLEDKYRWEQGFTLEAYTMEDSQETRDAFLDKREADFDR